MYGKSLSNQMEAAQCAVGRLYQTTALETTNQRIQNLEEELIKLKRLKVLLETHPEIEEIISLLR